MFGPVEPMGGDETIHMCVQSLPRNKTVSVGLAIEAVSAAPHVGDFAGGGDGGGGISVDEEEVGA